MRKFLLVSILSFLSGGMYTFSQCVAVLSGVPTTNGRIINVLPGCGGTSGTVQVPKTGYVQFDNLEVGGRYTVNLNANGSGANLITVRTSPTGGTVLSNCSGATCEFEATQTTLYAVINQNTCNGPWTATSAILSYTRSNPATPSVSTNITCSSNVLSMTNIPSSNNVATGTNLETYQWQGTGDLEVSPPNINNHTYTITAATNPQYGTYRVRVGYGSCYAFSAYNTVVPRANFAGNVVVTSPLIMGGVYNLSGDFTVNPGVTVTAASGCELTVNANNINVLGTINANGSGNNAENGGAGAGGALAIILPVTAFAGNVLSAPSSLCISQNLNIDLSAGTVTFGTLTYNWYVSEFNPSTSSFGPYTSIGVSTEDLVNFDYSTVYNQPLPTTLRFMRRTFSACGSEGYPNFADQELSVDVSIDICTRIWTGNTSTDWHTATNWIPSSVPQQLDNALIPDVSSASNNFPLISSPAGIADLTINSGASVSVAPGAGLTLDGTMTNNGIFTLQSDASGTGWLDDFTLGGTVVGNIRVQRYVPIGVAGFRQLGTPVTLNSISSVMNFIPAGNPGFVIPLSDCNPNWVAFNSPYGNWMQLVENGPVQFNCYQSLYQVLTSGNMTRGRGYYMDVPGGTTLTFVGAPNTGPISDFTATHANGAVTNGWNIVSNPYPSPLRWSMADVPAGFDAIAQVWVTSGTYLGTFQPVDPNTPGQGIAIGQAFQLRVSTPGSSVPFSVSNANRTTAPPSFLFSGNDPMTLNIDMSKGGHADLTKIRFMDDATPVYDGMFDSYKVLGNANQPMVYSILNNVNMSINSYGNLTDVYTVPLGIKAGTAGEHTFVFSNMDQFPASTLIYLEDTETGTWQNMRTDDSYSFNAPQGTHNSRFLVHFYPPVETATQDALCEVPGSVTITSASPAEWNYTLVDAQSTTVSSGTLTNGSVTVTNVAAGDYELTLTEVQSGYGAVETVTVNGTAAVVAQAVASSLNVNEGQEIQFTANAQNADTYSWSFGDGMTSADVNPLHTYNTAGTYEVVLTASNSTNTCSAVSTLSVTVSEAATSSVEEVEKENVKMWNVDNQVFITFAVPMEGKTTFTLYDAAGKRVMNTQLTNAQGTVTVDCGVLAAGSYTVELSNGQKVFTHKAIMGIK